MNLVVLLILRFICLLGIFLTISSNSFPVVIWFVAGRDWLGRAEEIRRGIRTWSRVSVKSTALLFPSRLFFKSDSIHYFISFSLVSPVTHAWTWSLTALTLTTHSPPFPTRKDTTSSYTSRSAACLTCYAIVSSNIAVMLSSLRIVLLCYHLFKFCCPVVLSSLQIVLSYMLRYYLFEYCVVLPVMLSSLQIESFSVQGVVGGESLMNPFLKAHCEKFAVSFA